MLEWAYKQDTGSATATAVLAYIVFRCNTKTYSWPSESMMAADLKITERTVRRAIKRLKDMGLLKVDKRGPYSHHHLPQFDNKYDGEIVRDRPSGYGLN